MLYQIDHQPAEFATSSRSADSESDEQLMARVQARNEAALATLANRHKALIRTVISRVVNNDADTDDVVQDVLVDLWNRAEGFDAEKGKALGWIVTMARRRAIDRVRRRQAYNRAEERNRIQVETQVAALQGGVEEDSHDSDRAEIIKNILATLPEAQRFALELAFFRGLSQREIAKTTGVPLGTIKTRLELGIRKVRAAVRAMGGAQEWSLTHA